MVPFDRPHTISY